MLQTNLLDLASTPGTARSLSAKDGSGLVATILPVREIGQKLGQFGSVPNLWLANCYFVISPIIPYDSPSCYHSSMRHFVVLFVHLIAILTQLLQPGGVRSLIAESLLLKHQLLIVNRSRQRSPNLSSWDRILAGWMALLVRPTRLLRSAIVLKPSTLLAFTKP